jgi:hypothetical protein
MLGMAIMLNLIFSILSFCSLVIGSYIYLKTGALPPMHEALSFLGWDISKLYSSTLVGYNEIIRGFLNTNIIYGSFELLSVSLIITWLANFFDTSADKFMQILRIQWTSCTSKWRK